MLSVNGHLVLCEELKQSAQYYGATEVKSFATISYMFTSTILMTLTWLQLLIDLLSYQVIALRFLENSSKLYNTYVDM